MNQSCQHLPPYLQRYCREQDYDAYTPEEHATWRYIMRRSRAFFKDNAVPGYLTGLKATGISLERIPSINAIDARLRAFGWGAVGVSGFIPPAAFLDFQARGIMPIAMDMRTIDHIAYTPAPDIVHEAAGHVPLLADPAYRHYLSRYATLAKKAIISRDDIRLYEAIRYLSDIKENPDTRPETVQLAEAKVTEVTRSIQGASELAQVARMNWWTAEYGLMGSLHHPRIYGAGLLSSVGESQLCLSDKVRKLRLSIDCIEQSYDITEPQPQLYVAESMEELPEILSELEERMSYKRGGVYGLGKAQEAGTVNTVVFDSGISVSGMVSEFISEQDHRIDFIKFNGPTQLAVAEQQIKGQGRERHPDGFSSPVGRWRQNSERHPADYSDADLERSGLRVGAAATLEFVSGFKVAGTLQARHRDNGKLTILTWNNCTVTRGAAVYYKPEWGEFDMVVGDAVIAVHGGPADLENYGDYELGNVSTSPGRSTPFSADEIKVFNLYQQIRHLRENAHTLLDLPEKLAELADTVARNYPQDWLLGLEILEVATQKTPLRPQNTPWLNHLQATVAAICGRHPVKKDMFRQGLELVAVND